ncbi:MAG TPA: helix-hairpin-helix domain-containing protein [Ideonella sp.]|nr:helix-hairpin-helix domain-containing protein [Ideonella sp.]
MTLLSLARVLVAAMAAFALGLPAAAAERVIDLNLANQAELEMVKGIGPQLSERILAERAKGRFESWPDFIARMKGIGPSHAARLSAAGLRVVGQAYAGSGEEPAEPAK